MLVGGPLRGLRRAFRISLGYCVTYFCVSGALAIVLGAIFGGVEAATIALYLGSIFGVFWVLFVLLPLSIVANMVFVRLFRKRTWRHERWRYWTAGVLGVVFTVGGWSLVGTWTPQVPGPFQPAIGQFVNPLYFGGWYILFSNLALLTAWALPSKR